MSKQSKMLKDDILKILAKELSGGSNTRPAFESAKTPNTFFGGKDVGNQPYYPSAQEPNPAANPASPIVPGIISDKDPSKRPTYKSAKTPQTFFGGAKKCKKAKAEAKAVCDEEKKIKKKRAPSPYNIFVKDYFSKNKNLGKDRMKMVAAAWKVSKIGSPKPAPAPKAAKPEIKLTTFQPPPPPTTPPPAKKGGRVPNAGKPLPKKQLQSFAKKEPSKPRTKKNSAWMAHLAEFRKANPSIAAKDMMKAAKQTYKKGGAHCGGELVLPSGGAEIKPDIKMTEDKHLMADGSLMSGKSHSAESMVIKDLVAAKKAGNVPEAPAKLPEKSEADQKKIMIDIMNSFDVFNKRFEQISNSNSSLAEKRSQYNNERDRLDKYKMSLASTYGDILSDDNKQIVEKAYKYALETYKIGVESLKEGTPQNRVDFENFDDNQTITEIIDKALSVPRTALDRARSFFSVPVKDYPIQTFNPTIPALGKMATIYPYGYQLSTKQIRGGQAKKTPKQMLVQLTKDLFIREMGKKYPEVPTKKIIAAYEKNIGDIRAIVTDMIIDSMEIRGGADCGPGEYASGDRCFKKEARPDTFDRDKFFSDQKREADSKERRDDGFTKQNDAPAITVDSSTKRTADAAMPLPAPKPQDKNEKGFVDKFSASITPPDSGIIFGTDASDITSAKDWVDSLANIFIGTASGVSTIFNALGDLF
jgi:hypothetical protein